MKETIRLGVKKPLNLLVVALISCLMIGTFIYVHTNQYKTFELRNKVEAIQLEATLLSYPIVNSTEGDPVYQNLLLQKQEVAKQLNSVLFNQPEKYAVTGLELAKLRKDIREEKEFNETVKALQPAIGTILSDELLYTALKKNGQQVILKPESMGSLSLLFIGVLGLIWFPMCAFLTSNILEDEFEHESLVKGQPKTLIKRTLNKGISLYVTLLLGMILAFVIGILLTQFLGDSMNDWRHVNVIQIWNLMVQKNWQIVLWYSLYFTILYFFTFLLSVFLNVVFRNGYLTLIIEILIFALAMILPEFVARSPWFIGGYLLPTNLFQGHYLLTEKQSLLNPVFGMLYLVCFGLVLTSLTSYLTRNGLKGGKR